MSAIHLDSVGIVLRGKTIVESSNTSLDDGLIPGDVVTAVNDVEVDNKTIVGLLERGGEVRFVRDGVAMKVHQRGGVPPPEDKKRAGNSSRLAISPSESFDLNVFSAEELAIQKRNSELLDEFATKLLLRRSISPRAAANRQFNSESKTSPKLFATHSSELNAASALLNELSDARVKLRELGSMLSINGCESPRLSPPLRASTNLLSSFENAKESGIREEVICFSFDQKIFDISRISDFAS